MLEIDLPLKEAGCSLTTAIPILEPHTMNQENVYYKLISI